MTVHPILAGLETLCVLSLMYYDVADRVLEDAVHSNCIRQRNVFLAAKIMVIDIMHCLLWLRTYE